MIHRAASSAVSIVGIVAAAYVETHGGDPSPYLYVALAAGGYAAGNAVEKIRNGKR